MDAIDKYDLSREVKFETFCAPRISGAILDELRSMDWVPRLVRHRSGQGRGRAPEDRDGDGPQGDRRRDRRAPATSTTRSSRSTAATARRSAVTSINRNCFSGDGNRELREIDVIKDEGQTSPVKLLQRRDLRELITKGLSRAERLIVILYYYEAMTMKEIGATLDLSESRVSQMHSSILQRLKAQMQHRMKELEEE
jgi:RNA polymerase sigma factor for flagellar operon FliA